MSFLLRNDYRPEESGMDMSPSSPPPGAALDPASFARIPFGTICFWVAESFTGHFFLKLIIKHGQIRFEILTTF